MAPTRQTAAAQRNSPLWLWFLFMHILRVLPLRGALPAQPVQDGASAVYAKAVFLPDVRQQFLTHAAPQMRQLSAGEALEMEVLAAIRFADILIYEAFLPCRAVCGRNRPET